MSIAVNPLPPPASARGVRIGIVQGGRLVEERLLMDPRRVTIGSDAGNTFVVPPGPLGRAWTLIERRRGRYVLHDPAGSVLLLPEAARGRVVAGDTTVLYQLVRPAPPRPRAQLPPSLRGGWRTGIDPAFAIVAALSFLAHLVLVVYLHRVDWPRAPEPAELPPRWVHVPRIVPPPVPMIAPPAQPAPSAPTHAGSEVRPKPGRIDRGVIQALTAFGGTDALRDRLGLGAVTRDQEEALGGLGGVTTDGEAGLARLLPGDGTGKLGTTSGLRGDREISVANVLGAQAERRVPIRVGPVTTDDTGPAPDDLARLIRGHLVDIRLCYERALKRRPELSGKLLVRFTLTAAGTVAGVAIDEDTMGDAEVAACVRSVVGRWRFPAPPRGGVEVSFPFVFQAAR